MTMTVPEAARKMGVSRDAVRKAIHRGTLPARAVPGGKGGRSYRIEPIDFALYYASHLRDRDPERVAGREAYRLMATGATVGPKLERMARTYATARRRAWPPR